MTGSREAPLREYYQADQLARLILDYFARRERNSRVTKLDRLQNLLDGEHEFSRGDLVAFFRRLQEIGCGTFVPGRHGHPSRFEWTADLITVGQVASGESDRVSDDVSGGDDEANGGDDVDFLDHPFNLRPNLRVHVKLPGDLSVKEAERLADFVKSLPFS